MRLGLVLDVDREEYRFRVDVVMCVRSIDLKYIYIIYIYIIYIDELSVFNGSIEKNSSKYILYSIIN